MDGRHRPCAEILRVLESAVLEGVAFIEDTPCKEPAGNVVLASHLGELGLRDGGNYLLRPLEVVGTCCFPSAGVGHHKVPESEFPADILSKLVGERFGALHQKAGAYGLGHCPHALLGALHENWHLGDFLPYEFTEVHSGVQLLLGGFVVSVEHKTYVRDHSKEVFLVLVVKGYGVVVVCGHEDFGPCALAEDLLVFVHGVKDGIRVLLKDKLIQEGEVCGIVPHGVFHKKDCLDAAFQDVGGGVHAVFQKLYYGNYEIRGAVPVEDVVHA